MSNDGFRAEVAAWVKENLPQSIAGKGLAPFGGFEGEASIQGDALVLSITSCIG